MDVRLTSDCLLIDPKLIDEIVAFAINNDFDYVSNTLKPSYPDGLDVEIFKSKVLNVAYKNTINQNRNMLPHTCQNSTFLVKINLHQRIIK